MKLLTKLILFFIPLTFLVVTGVILVSKKQVHDALIEEVGERGLAFAQNTSRELGQAPGLEHEAVILPPLQDLKARIDAVSVLSSALRSATAAFAASKLPRVSARKSSNTSRIPPIRSARTPISSRSENLLSSKAWALISPLRVSFGLASRTSCVRGAMWGRGKAHLLPALW
jgi:hypothetical protein